MQLLAIFIILLRLCIGDPQASDQGEIELQPLRPAGPVRPPSPDSPEVAGPPVRLGPPPPPPDYVEIRLPPLPRGYPNRLILFRSPPSIQPLHHGREIGYRGRDNVGFTFHDFGRELQVSNLYGQAVLLLQGLGRGGIPFTVGARFALNDPSPVVEAVVMARHLAGEATERIHRLTLVMPTLGEGNSRTDSRIMNDWIVELESYLEYQLPSATPTLPGLYSYRPITENTERVSLWNFITTPQFRDSGDPDDLEGARRAVGIDGGSMAPPPPIPPDPLTPSLSPSEDDGGGLWACILSPFSCFRQTDVGSDA